MINWLIEQEQNQKTIFNTWKDKSIEEMKNFHNKYPFLNCEIYCLFEKDEWLTSGTIKVDYQLTFNLKPEHEQSFLLFMSNLFDKEVYEKYESTLKNIVNTETKKLTLPLILKQINKLNKEKYNPEDWALFNEYYSKYDKYSTNEEENELDGMRTMLGEHGLLTNTWITILDKIRAYDIEFTLTNKNLTIMDNSTEYREGQYNQNAYGLNGLNNKTKKPKI